MENGAAEGPTLFSRARVFTRVWLSPSASLNLFPAMFIHMYIPTRDRRAIRLPHEDLRDAFRSSLFGHRCVTHFAHRCSVIAAMFGCRPWNPDSVSLSAGSAQIRALRPATPQICRTLPTFQPLHKGSRLCSRPTCVVAFAEGETAVLGLKRRRAASAAWAPC